MAFAKSASALAEGVCGLWGVLLQIVSTETGMRLGCSSSHCPGENISGNLFRCFPRRKDSYLIRGGALATILQRFELSFLRRAGRCCARVFPQFAPARHWYQQ